MAEKNVQRLPSEELYQRELEALIAAEREAVPTGWRMSPRSVLTYITGGVTVNGVEITPKYMGSRRLVEIVIATLVTDRALLLIGEPGTAKSWLSEHLAAAVNGDSTKVIQGTAGTTEEQIRYSWNYARLYSRGSEPHLGSGGFLSAAAGTSAGEIPWAGGAAAGSGSAGAAAGEKSAVGAAGSAAPEPGRRPI